MIELLLTLLKIFTPLAICVGLFWGGYVLGRSASDEHWSEVVMYLVDDRRRLDDNEVENESKDK